MFQKLQFHWQSVGCLQFWHTFSDRVFRSQAFRCAVHVLGGSPSVLVSDTRCSNTMKKLVHGSFKVLLVQQSETLSWLSVSLCLYEIMSL